MAALVTGEFLFSALVYRIFNPFKVSLS